MFDWLWKENERYAKHVRGWFMKQMIARYLIYFDNHYQLGERLDLVLFANYTYLRVYFIYVANVLHYNYGFIKPTKMQFRIEKRRLLQLSEIFAEAILPFIQDTAYPHFQLMKTEEYKKASTYERQKLTNKALKEARKKLKHSQQ